MKMNSTQKILILVSFTAVVAIGVLFASGIIPQNSSQEQNGSQNTYTNPNKIITTLAPKLDDAIVGVPYHYSFDEGMNPSGGSPPYTFYLGSGVGFPPMGLVMDPHGLLSGTPSAEGTKNFEVCVKDLGGNQDCKRVSLKVNPASDALTSIYEGTYSGKFNYEYRDGYYTSDSPNELKYTPWKAESFDVALTFKTIRKDSSSDQDPYVYLDVTNGVCSDTNFGTEEGVDPTGNFGSSESASLPVNPAQQDAKYSSLILMFPNGAQIEVKEGTIKVSPDGKTLSNNPEVANASTSWNAKTLKGPLWLGTPTAETSVWMTRYYSFKNWKLTKVS
ncbi:MAG: hypothetical protein JXA43_00095 [Candidatus Diapherotrites archaeon]|nr:hypothetical protein [Candidatus Diapherotrites archaeon]